MDAELAQKRGETVLDLIDQMKRHCAPAGFGTLAKIERLTDEMTTEIVSLTMAGASPALPSQYSRHFTKYENRLFNALRAAGDKGMTQQGLVAAMYFDRYNEDDIPEIKIIQVLMTRLRKKIAALNLPFEIETIYGAGYCMHEKCDVRHATQMLATA